MPMLEYVDDSGRLITWDIVPAPRPRVEGSAAARAHVWRCIVSVTQGTGSYSGAHFDDDAGAAYAGALRHLGQARDHVAAGNKRGPT